MATYSPGSRSHLPPRWGRIPSQAGSSAPAAQGGKSRGKSRSRESRKWPVKQSPEISLFFPHLRFPYLCDREKDHMCSAQRGSGRV